jgi:hypothetical protein
MMDSDKLAERLGLQAHRIEAMLSGVSDEQWCWRPSEGDWSMLEVVAHLADEERHDFRTRLDILLHRPDDEMPPIDPQGWVTARGYNQRDPGETLADFLIERERSLTWLRGLVDPDWERSVMAPWGRPLRAGDMAASWAAHDLLHLRQLVELHWAWGLGQVQPYDVSYAGEW